MAPKPPTLNTRLFFIHYERNPKPINPTTYVATAMNLADPRSTHPFSIRTARRHRAFDPKKLHWAVHAPLGLSRSAYIRSCSVRRLREAFRSELRKAGWDEEGRRLERGGEVGSLGDSDLSGALKLALTKEPFSITATGEEVRVHAAEAVQTLVRMQRYNGRDGVDKKKKWAWKGTGKSKGVAGAKTRWVPAKD